MSEAAGLSVLLVDPSLFTAPYDAALTRGLLAAGVRPRWAVRPTRDADPSELPEEHTDSLFYTWIDKQRWLPPTLHALGKGVAHVWGLGKLLRRIVQLQPDVVHFQWVVVPPLDSLAMLLVGLRHPLVLTVHDTVPFNGDRMSLLQRWGFEVPLRLSDRIIVHTKAGREALLARGFAPEKVVVIPHGALALRGSPPVAAPTKPSADTRYHLVLFGELKHYKGIDILVEALARLPPALRAQTRVTVAGRPRMALAPVQARIRELDLSGTVELRAQRLSEAEMATLFASADCFVFPYRQIDASGVYFLVKSLGKWLIASRVGIFAEDFDDGKQGELVPSGDVQALAAAIARAVEGRLAGHTIPVGSDWLEIGATTHALYRDLQRHRPRAVGATLSDRGAPG